MNREDLKSRTKRFAHDCVKFAVGLPEYTLGRHLKSQLIRASTSVAANYRAACIAQSKKTFVAKLSIVIEEIDESHFWIEFAQDEHLLPENICEPLKKEAKELTLIFAASRRTANLSLNK